MIGSSSVRLGDVSRDGGGARTLDEQTAGSGIRTSGNAMPVALERHHGKVKATCPRSPPSPMTPDHLVAVVVNPDASHSFAAPDGDGHGAHGPRDRGGSFGSAVRPRVAARAGRFGHSRRHNRSGRDRSSYRSALERGNGHTERNGLAFRPRRRAPEVDEVYNE